MSQSWYYARGNDQFGPVTIDQLKGLIGTGQVQMADLVWTEGMAQWMAAQTVPDLVAQTTPNPYIAPPIAPPPTVNPYSTNPVAQNPAWPGSAAPSGVLGYDSPAYAGVQPAGFWLRFAAYIIDWIIMVVVGAIVGGIIGGVAGGSGIRPGSVQWASVAFVIKVSSFIVWWLYYAFMEAS